MPRQLFYDSKSAIKMACGFRWAVPEMAPATHHQAIYEKIQKLLKPRDSTSSTALVVIDFHEARGAIDRQKKYLRPRCSTAVPDNQESITS